MSAESGTVGCDEPGTAGSGEPGTYVLVGVPPGFVRPCCVPRDALAEEGLRISISPMWRGGRRSGRRRCTGGGGRSRGSSPIC